MGEIRKKNNFVLIMAIYLAGIFMGALDTGIVTPARTIIQNNLGVDTTTGVWMITIYTLAYAASIPVMGKLADRYGRKMVYLTSIILFGAGSLFCGLSQSMGSFTALLIARAIQAVGGGGILPVATAEFGTTFPPEKRGLALGLVGGVFGIANVFGASVGSAILDIFGQNNWQFIFYINLPISIFIIIAGIFALENGKNENLSKIDGLGILTLVVMILSLLYGLKNIDFFHISDSIVQAKVYFFLILFVVLIPVFIWLERRAEDPVMNLHYFVNRNIALTLAISFLSGFVMMGIIFVPQFCENALKIATGSGGYLVIILGIFAGMGAPVSGKLIDKFGAKIILAIGFAATILSSIFLIFVTTVVSNFFTVFVGLVFIGIGIGFTMGTPLNYMMLANTEEKESNSALATLSLMRSIGMAIAPAIMIGFIAHAGTSVQADVMKLLPGEINIPKLSYAEEITDEVKRLKADPAMADKMSNFSIPDLTAMSQVKIDMNSGSADKVPKEMIELMQTSDITTITKNSKAMAAAMFKTMSPDMTAEIQNGISQGIDGIEAGISQITDAKFEMRKGSEGIGKGIAGMEKAVQGQKNALSQLRQTSIMIKKMLPAQNPANISEMIPASVKKNIPAETLKTLAAIKDLQEYDQKIQQMKSGLSGLQSVSAMLAQQGIDKIPDGKSVADLLPPQAQNKIPAQTLKQLSKITSISQLDQNIKSMQKALSQMEKYRKMISAPGSTKTRNLAEMIPASVKKTMPPQALAELKKIKSVEELAGQIEGLEASISDLERKIAQNTHSRSKMDAAISEMDLTVADMKSLQRKMNILNAEIPSAFESASEDYLAQIDKKSGQIEEVFQATLNDGFKNVFGTSAVASLIALFLLAFYTRKGETL